MTEKGKAHQVEIKLTNRNSAFKRLKKQIERINALHDSPETTHEQLEEERFYLNQLKDEFNDAHKDLTICWNSRRKGTLRITGLISWIENSLSVELESANASKH